MNEKYPLVFYKVIGHQWSPPFDFNDAIEWAIEMLRRGYETPNLLIVAALPRYTNYFEGRHYLNEALKELNMPAITLDQAIAGHTYYLTKKIIEETDAVEIRKQLSELHNYFQAQDNHANEFSMLYWAMDELEYDEYQHYWQGATRENIISIIKEEAKKWLEDNKDEVYELISL